MKKTLSIILAIAMLLTSLGISNIAFAESENKLLSYVESQIDASANYLITSDSQFTVENAVDALTFIKANKLTQAQKSNFVENIAENLSKNDGKIIGTDGESLGAYGAIIQALEKLGYSAENFNGYNIYDAFNNMDVYNEFNNKDALSKRNPYYYRYAIEIANKERAIEICNAYIKTYYVMGKGLYYYGYSCDNTAQFLTAISKYQNEFADYVGDAKKVIDSYTKDNGCYYNTVYNPFVNADSTANAMLAYSSLGNTSKAFDYYKNLVEGFESRTGIFTFLGSDDENAYATKDALIGLEAFRDLIKTTNFEHTKEVEKVAVSPASCTKNGKRVYTCVICGSNREETINAKGHNWNNGIITKKATCTTAGVKTYTCTICRATKTTVIPKASSVKLSTTSYTYNGKVKKPTVTVKDSNGNTLKNGTDYTVSYASGRKYVGKYAVTVKFKGNYSGTKKLYFTIKPRTTSISKLTTGTKKFTVKWYKRTTQNTGYQIQYATNSKFSKAKTVTVSKNSTTSKTISKLSAKKKYYVRVRTYKTVNGTKYYSSWSKAKSIKTK